MKVQEVMTPLVVSVNVDAPVVAAAQIMRSNEVGFLPVRAEGRLVGGLTDRDIVIRAAAEGLDLSTTRIDEIMTPRVLSVRDDVDAGEALRIMSREQVSRLMVVDADEHLLGILSIHDIPQAAVG